MHFPFLLSLSLFHFCLFLAPNIFSSVKGSLQRDKTTEVNSAMLTNFFLNENKFEEKNIKNGMHQQFKIPLDNEHGHYDVDRNMLFPSSLKGGCFVLIWI